MSDPTDHVWWMRAALSLGRRSQGLAAPNPSVGALVVQNGIVLGRGVTAVGGRPHAEPVALAQAGTAARGATLYVTLEPCSHHGRSPPCVDAVLRSGVARVVVALRDPDPRVAGRGIATLRAAGLDVVENVCAAEAYRDHLGHLRRVTLGRPMVTVKMAQTGDGVAAAPAGSPRLMITGEAANNAVQMMRATHDAILVGRGTAEADDPRLTVRLPGLERRNVLRIVVDSSLSIGLGSNLVTSAGECPVLILAAPNASAERELALAERGVTVSRIAAGPDGIDLAAGLAELGSRGLTRVLCEGGPHLASRLIVQSLADRVVVLTSASDSTGGGSPTFTREAATRLHDPGWYRLVDERHLGSDLMQVYEAVEARCLPV